MFVPYFDDAATWKICELGAVYLDDSARCAEPSAASAKGSTGRALPRPATAEVVLCDVPRPFWGISGTLVGAADHACVLTDLRAC